MDPDAGYLLDVRYAFTVGYNMESLRAYSAVLGWHMSRFVTLRAEYTHLDVDPVRGVSPAILAAAGNLDFWSIEVGVDF